MSYRPKYLGHVNIYVRNVERSHKWYEDVLGLHTYDYMPGRAAFMSADQEQSHEVALMQVGDDAALQQKRQVGLNHMAWMMHSLDDLKDAYQRLKDLNVPIEHVSDHGISIGIYFRDPDGNGIEVSYELPRNQWARHDKVFSGEGRSKGLFPGPWDEGWPHRWPQFSGNVSDLKRQGTLTRDVGSGFASDARHCAGSFCAPALSTTGRRVPGRVYADLLCDVQLFLPKFWRLDQCIRQGCLRQPSAHEGPTTP